MGNIALAVIVLVSHLEISSGFWRKIEKNIACQYSLVNI